jgi:ribosomal protein S18 acetylase RimI-like enzyme
MIREILDTEMEQLLELYTHLHDNAMPQKTKELLMLWESVMKDKNYHIIVAIEDERVVSSCICAIIPNFTHNQRPYAIIENVITRKDYRNRGFASKCLDYAREIAILNNCYKVMLLTGSKEESTLNFYIKAGYNYKDKTAFIQWL